MNLVNKILLEYQISVSNKEVTEDKRYDFLLKSKKFTKEQKNLLIDLIEQFRKQSGSILPCSLVKIKDLIPTQKNINKARLKNIEKNKDTIKTLGNKPFIVKLEEKFYILDGHHRIFSDKKEKKKEIEVKILDLDKSNTLLLLNGYC